jgi:hypothetical protein
MKNKIFSEIMEKQNKIKLLSGKGCPAANQNAAPEIDYIEKFRAVIKSALDEIVQNTPQLGAGQMLEIMRAELENAEFEYFAKYGIYEEDL